MIPITLYPSFFIIPATVDESTTERSTTGRAHLVSVFPPNGEKLVKRSAVEAVFRNESTSIKQDSVKITLNGEAVEATAKKSGDILTVTHEPDGGIAPGLDRIVMLLANEKNIREVTLFPMNQNAQDLMMDAPSEIDEKQLKELGLQIKKK